MSTKHHEDLCDMCEAKVLIRTETLSQGNHYYSKESYTCSSCGYKHTDSGGGCVDKPKPNFQKPCCDSAGYGKWCNCKERIN